MPPIIGLVIVGIVVWHILRRRQRTRPGPQNVWENRNSIAMEETGEWDPDTQVSTSSERPRQWIVPGNGL
jgi:hypothetical protein